MIAKQPHPLLLWIVKVGFIVLTIMSLMIVGGVVFTAIVYNKPNEVLINWGGLFIGFFLGSFFNLVQRSFGVHSDGEGPANERQ